MEEHLVLINYALPLIVKQMFVGFGISRKDFLRLSS
jgi:hypothetical protein